MTLNLAITFQNHQIFVYLGHKVALMDVVYYTYVFFARECILTVHSQSKGIERSKKSRQETRR